MRFPPFLPPLPRLARRFGLLLALKIALTALALLAFSRPGHAAEAPVETAILEFRTQVAGDAPAIARSAERLNQLSAERPTEPRLMAYAGAATARLARTTMLPWKKIGYAEDGVARLDQALGLLRPEHEQAQDGAAPDAMVTRLVAANTFLALPGMFNRAARGEKLLEGLLQHPALASTPEDFRSAVYFLAGEHAREGRKLDEARAYYERVLPLKGLETERARAALEQIKAGRS